MEYCLRNVGEVPANAIGLTVAPGKVSRALSQAEVERLWAMELDPNLKLEPLLMESADVKKPALLETEAEKETAAGPAKRGGRQKRFEADS